MRNRYGSLFIVAERDVSFLGVFLVLGEGKVFPAVTYGGSMVFLQAQQHWQGQYFPKWEELSSSLRVVRLPMRVKFRGVLEREAVIFSGPCGWGEFSPFVEYSTAEAASWLLAGIEAAWLGFPAPVRSEVAVNATLPAVAPGEVERILSNYRGEMRELKVKVAERGQDLADDLARLREVRQLFPQVRLKVDANMGWNHEQALVALEAFEEFDLLYAEQPVAGVEGLAHLKEAARTRGLSTPIAADEAVRKAEDPLRVAQLGAADLMVIKAAPLGGVRSAAHIVEQAGLPVVVSSALDTSVGISMGVALAASLPHLPYGNGLGTLSLMQDDVTPHPLTAHNGSIPVRKVEPASENLARLEIRGERRDWWLARTKACYTQLCQELAPILT